MSYNKYTPRTALRYNTPGTFVPAGSSAGGASGRYANTGPPRHLVNVQTYSKPVSQQNANANSPMMQDLPPPPPQPVQAPPHMDPESMETNTIDVKADMSDSDANAKPFWMKSKLVGVKKISNKERRRRQNENLRRLLTPKNALMVLNEIMSGEQLANQFKVVSVSGGASQYYKPVLHSFCAELAIDGVTYTGYGETKMVARNNAAEQAIRDLMIKRMSRLFGDAAYEDGNGNGNGAAQGAGGGEGEGGAAAEGEGGAGAGAEALPMIQLASYALHKLFTEWECEGHKVPQLKPHTTSEAGSDIASTDPTAGGVAGVAGGVAGAAGGVTGKGKARGPRALPAHAAAMHPCMLLTYMRPQLEYRELPARGDSPQTMLFTMAIDVDGVTYVGRAGNKKEARKAAAKGACEELFNVKFEF